ncbi:MAG: glycosyl hydrolase [Akkermansiaceae bacterium]|nr:glycosyl hydrolase [Akkermansiaceae bacterium]
MEANQLTPEEVAEGFELLFNGTDLSGWRTYRETAPRPQWQVLDGAIVLTEDGGGDLVTEEKFDDFDLRFDWKISEHGNSGVMWRVAETQDYPWRTGPEYQILDSFDKPDHKYAREIAKGNIGGCFYDLVPAKPEWSKPPNEWNVGRIVVDGTKITLYLNGIVTADVDTATPEWEAMLAKSKFHGWEFFNKEAEGHICLQDHHDVVAFRNLRIRPL